MTTQSCCPTCGGVIDDHRFLVDLNTNNLSYKGWRFPLEPKTASILYVLAQASPKYISDEKMTVAVWGEHEVDYPKVDVNQNLRVYISRARKMLRPLGVSIERTIRLGYRMYFHQLDTPTYTMPLQSPQSRNH